VLLQHRQVSPEGLIVLYASRDARYEDVIQVLDMLRLVGGDRVALATLPGESPDSFIPGASDPSETGLPNDPLLDLSPFPTTPDTLPESSDNSPLQTLPAEPSDAPLTDPEQSAEP
jgi:biopolymer transport protein ExbD